MTADPNKRVFKLQQYCAELVAGRSFERLIVGLIVLNAAVLGLETLSSLVEQYGNVLRWIN